MPPSSLELSILPIFSLLFGETDAHILLLTQLFLIDSNLSTDGEEKSKLLFLLSINLTKILRNNEAEVLHPKLGHVELV